MGSDAELVTTRGSMTREDLGLILPHEHVFVDLGPIEAENWRDAEAGDVVGTMSPYVEDAMAAGVTALVECTPEGVGRRADIDAAVSEATGLPIVLPTGIYQEPNVPDWAYDATEEELFEWLCGELTEGIEGTGCRAAWIKVSASPEGMTDVEERILRAAARAGAATGATIGSHTTDAGVLRDQLDVIERHYRPEGFVWIHTQTEPDVGVHLEVTERGAWIEYDAIGDEADADCLDRIERVLDAGLGDRLLLSQDRGWYDPSEPGGGEPDPYTYLPETFLPALEARVGEADARRLTEDNPFRAFAR